MVPECGGGRKIGWGCETQQKDHRKKKKMWTLESLNLESESPGNDGGRAALRSDGVQNALEAPGPRIGKCPLGPCEVSDYRPWQVQLSQSRLFHSPMSCSGQIPDWYHVS